MSEEHYQIGIVAENVGLSLRTIRYYEEIGLVTPTGRTEGGFRLYTDPDIDRLRLLKCLKPVGMSLETMGELLEHTDQLARGGPLSADAQRQLETAFARAFDRCDELEEGLEAARDALRNLSRLAGKSTR